MAIIIVLGVVIVIVASLTLTTLMEQKLSRNFNKSFLAYYAAESGIEDSIYRIVKGKYYQASNSLDVESSLATINISGSSNQKVILVNGEQDNRFRNLQVKLGISADAVSFYYGIQVGEGGMIMGNNSQITAVGSDKGSVYSNGNIQGGNGATITGDAFVATGTPLLDQQSINADSDFIFGRSGNQIDAAQSFMPSATDKLTKVSLYLKKFGNPGNKTVRILTNNGTQPSKNLVASGASGTLIASQISQSAYGWIDVVIGTPPTIQAGTTYWIAIDTSADGSNYFLWGEDPSDAYSGGTGKYSPNWNASSPTWFPVNGDLAFKTWMGGVVNSLDNIDIGGNAHANTIKDCDITGDAYYQTISGGSVDGTQYPGSPDPVIAALPISESNIADWKTDAEKDGTPISGDYNLGIGETDSLGPKKIIGDMNILNGADFTVTGTIYVTGDINIDNVSTVRLGTNYGQTSGVVLTDGTINVTNISVFYTNGAGTYLMLLSTKTGDAINIANSTETVVFYASAGNINVGNANLKEVTGYKITLANGAKITYESGLASAQFSAGGTGGGWAISSWEEVP